MKLMKKLIVKLNYKEKFCNLEEDRSNNLKRKKKKEVNL